MKKYAYKMRRWKHHPGPWATRLEEVAGGHFVEEMDEVQEAHHLSCHRFGCRLEWMTATTNITSSCISKMTK